MAFSIIRHLKKIGKLQYTVPSSLIKINVATKQLLDRLKTHPRETYDEVVMKLLEPSTRHKCLCAKEPLKAGDTITQDKLVIAEQERGLSPSLLSRIDGHPLLYDVRQGEAITFGHIDFRQKKERTNLEKPETSIIIRTRNEEQWIERCLSAIAHQDYQDFEVVIVDNESTDGTLSIAMNHHCKLVHITKDEFNYSLALNKGIREASGKYIVMISGHCLPINHKWLGSLVQNLRDNEVAGVYGRQEPLPDSDAFDKRDLWTTFGPERRVQRKDFFFHNANSAIKKSHWQEVPFDENIHGVEDRHWAKQMIQRGKAIIYEPDASVFHHHGIHQGRDAQRAERVARVIELIQDERLE